MELTITCDRCGENGFHWGKWYNPRTRERISRLYDKYDNLHECDGVRRVSSPSVTVTPTVDLEKIMGFVASTLEAYDAKIAGTVKNGITQLSDGLDTRVINLAANQVTSRLAGLPTEVRELVEKVVRELVPVEHSIVVSDLNGEIKRLNTRPHMTLGKLVRYAAVGKPIMLVGPAASGKSTAAMQLAEILNRRLFIRSIDPTTSGQDLLGWITAGGTFVPGFLIEAYINGGLCMIDEVDNGTAEALTAINTPIENGILTLSNGETVTRHKDFQLVTGANTWGHGADRLYLRNQLDGAFLSRFIGIEWDYDEDAELDWAGRDQVDWTRFVQRCRGVAFRQRIRHIISPRTSINGAALLRIGVNREDVENDVLWPGCNPDDRTKILANI